MGKTGSSQHPYDFPTVLSQLMTERSLSQAQLARRAGYDHSFISRLLSRERTPDSSVLNFLSQGMELRFSESAFLYLSAGYLHPAVHLAVMKGKPVNVLDVMAQNHAIDFSPPTPARILELLDRRRESYQGFAALERERGFLSPVMSLATSQGQEAVRILLLRGIEELLEFVDADLQEHQLEELIDSWNYFLSIAVLDPSVNTTSLATELANVFETEVLWGRGLEEYQLYGDVLRTVNPFLAKLRNRPWQNHAQSLYFDGWVEYVEMMRVVTITIIRFFPDWPTFVTYFLAKDEVLQFRLRTKY